MPTTRRRWTGEGAGLRGRQARPGVREGKGKEQEVSSPCLVSSRQEWTLPSHFIEIFIFKCWLSVVTIKAANTPMWELVLGGYTCPRSPFLVSLRSSQFPRRPRSPLSPSPPSLRAPRPHVSSVLPQFCLLLLSSPFLNVYPFSSVLDAVPGPWALANSSFHLYLSTTK